MFSPISDILFSFLYSLIPFVCHERGQKKNNIAIPELVSGKSAIFCDISIYHAIYRDISRYIAIYPDISRYIRSKIGDISNLKSDISPILDPIYRDISMIYHDILIYLIISSNISRYIMKWYIAIYHIWDISRDISIYRDIFDRLLAKLIYQKISF